MILSILNLICIDFFFFFFGYYLVSLIFISFGHMTLHISNIFCLNFRFDTLVDICMGRIILVLRDFSKTNFHID